MIPKKLLREKGVNAEYGIHLPWLRKMRLLRKGPPFLKLNRAINYRREDLERWLELRRVETK